MLRFRFISIIIFLSCGYAGNVFAEYWRFSTIKFGGDFYTPESACAAYNIFNKNTNYVPVMSSNGINFTCSGYGNGFKFACTNGTVFNVDAGECLPVEQQCESGSKIHSWAPATNSGGILVPNAPSSVCLSGCGYQETLDFGHTGCIHTVDAGYKCAVTFSSTGSECSPGDSGAGGDGDGDGGVGTSPLDDETPGGDPVEHCDRFANADGSWGYDCTAKPPPDDDTCPPGYMLQGTTCFRIPPDHPNYDPAKDPHNNNQGGDGGDTGGDTGGTGGGTGGDTGGTGGGTGGDTGGTGGDTGGTGGTGGGTGGTGGTGGGTGGTGGTGGNNGGDGGDGSGSGVGSGDGENTGDEGGGTGQGVELCEGERCGFGSERGDPFGEDVPSFGESFELIYQGMVNSPIGQSVSNIQFPSGGSCPVLSTSIGVFGKTIPIEFSAHCTLWEQIAPILSAAFLALWSLLAIRIFLSA